MLLSDAPSIPDSPPGVLTPATSLRLPPAASLIQALRRRQLAPYAVVMRGLDQLLSYGQVYVLWHELFGEAESLPAEPEAAQERFLRRVNDELFPLDWDFIEAIRGERGHALAEMLVPETFGIPWEADDRQYVGDAAQDLLSLLTGEEPEYEPEYDRAGEPPPRLTWPAAPPAIIDQLLASLPEPLGAGLGATIQCLSRDNDNVFLDYPPLPFWDDYGQVDCGWDVPTIRALAAEWSTARSVIAAADRYHEWWQTTPGARAIVRQALLDLEHAPAYLEFRATGAAEEPDYPEPHAADVDDEEDDDV